MFKIFINLLNIMKYRGLFFTKFSSFATIATIFSLWLTGYINTGHQDVLGYVLILSVGILHGANDLKLLQNSLKDKSVSAKLLLVRYILIVAFVGISFFIIPSTALLVFILLSSYHFGEQHLHHKLKSPLLFSYGLYTFYGLLIFSLLFYLNQAETSKVIFGITGINISALVYRVIFVATAILLLGFTVFGYSKRFIKASLFEEVFLILVFFIIFKIASLIWAFAIYFIFWHSLPSLKDQMQVLYGNSTKKTVKSYILSSFVYWLIAIIGLGISIYVFRNHEALFLPVFFSFLAAITLPHVLVMHKIMHD